MNVADAKRVKQLLNLRSFGGGSFDDSLKELNIIKILSTIVLTSVST